MTGSPFDPTSRYALQETTTWTAPDGHEIVYVRRRFVPSPNRFAVIAEHQVREGERIDNIAAQHFGNSELFWRIADANGALHPDELTQRLGRRLAITLPEGIPGAP